MPNPRPPLDPHHLSPLVDGLRRGEAQPPIYIGALSAQVGASAKAIRLYESLGLLGTVARQGVYRVYSAQQVERVRLIRQAQGLGFRLADLAPALGVRGREPDWVALAQLVHRHRAALAVEVKRLQSLDRVLHDIGQDLLTCGSGEPNAALPRVCTP